MGTREYSQDLVNSVSFKSKSGKAESERSQALGYYAFDMELAIEEGSIKFLALSFQSHSSYMNY